MSTAPPPPPRLELIFDDGPRVPCKDGDVLGREGTVGAAAFARAGTLSRRHLLVRWQEGTWTLSLESTARNETLLDGRPMEPRAPRRLPPGEHRVEVEDFGFTLRVAEAAPDPLAASLPGLPGLGRLRQEFGGGDSMLRLIADNVDELIAVIDQDGQRVWNNVTYLTCLGYDPKLMRETDSMEELHPDDVATVRAAFEESMRTGAGRSLEYRMRHRAGHWVSLESQGRVVAAESGGGKKYLVLVARDVTARREAEARARRRVQRQTERAGTLAALSQSTQVQSGDLEGGFASVAKAAVLQFGCGRAGVWLFSTDRQTLICQESFEAETLEHRRGGGVTLSAAACPEFLASLGAERCLPVDDAATDARVRELLPGYLAPAGVFSFLAAGLRMGGETLGMLSLERLDAAERWTLEDQEFAASLADVLLLAMEVRRRAEAFRALETSQRALAAELAEAAAYVRALLPEPLSGEVESEWRFVPCTALGGDGLGHHWLEDGGDHLAIYLVDVVGHGVGAALLASSALNTLRNGSLPGVDFRRPAGVLGALNRAFDMERQNNLFFTVWYGVYDRVRREIAFAAAGHPPAVLLPPETADGNGSEARLGEPGLMIGVEADAVYREGTSPAPAGSRLYVFSDGAFEITLADGEAWGFDQFVATLGRAPAEPGRSELDGLRQRLEALHGSPELPDDFSVLRLTFH